MHERTAPHWDEWSGLVSLENELEREFEARLTECSTLAFRVAFSVLRHREDAEDVAQEAFAKAYRSFRQLRDRDRFRAWLVRMTWRMALDRQRAVRRRTAREESVLRPAVVVPEVEAEERAALLWRAIDTLSEKLRMVIVLAAIEGYDVREVATLLELPEGTVKSRLFLARQQLKESLSWMVKTDRR
jgi:RNA polymerase sigma-70 factor, ECF subfamily